MVWNSPRSGPATVMVTATYQVSLTKFLADYSDGDIRFEVSSDWQSY